MSYELWLLVYALGAARMSHIIAKEDGPFRIFDRLRTTCNNRYDCNFVWQFFADVLTCVNCLSVWVGMGVAAIFLLYGHQYLWMNILALGFAFSAISVLLDR